MSQLAKRLTWFGCFLLAFSALTMGLVYSVTYKPYGVPDHRREEYERKIAFLRNREKSAQKNIESSSPDRPIAKLGPTFHDFGRVDPHQTLEHSFQIRNEGKTPLSLEIRGTSCKCTIGKLGVPVVMPGEKTEVTLSWNTGYKAEEYEQAAVLNTNDPLQKTIQFRVRGVIRSDLVVPSEIGFPKTDIAGVAKSSFIVYSQLWDGLTVADVSSDLEGLDWFAEPLELTDASLADSDPRSAWRVTLTRPVYQHGEYEGELTVSILPGTGESEVKRTIAIHGETRSPIAFLGPKIKQGAGLEIGTVSADQDHEFHLTVQVRSDPTREIKVLDVEPKLLKASLKPGRREGYHKLTITVPKGAPTEMFNREDHHGFVSIGDPKNKAFSNWFPIFGGVANLEN